MWLFALYGLVGIGFAACILYNAYTKESPSKYFSGMEWTIVACLLALFLWPIAVIQLVIDKVDEKRYGSAYDLEDN